MIEFIVEDTGNGISKENQQQMFKLFGKIKKSNDYNSTGVGLGLTYCKKVVHHMKGEIFCKSEKERGTKFTFFIKIENKKGDIGLSKIE